jgi:hypothetical protein
MWKPEIADRAGATPDFVVTVLRTDIPATVVQLGLAGNATLTLKEGQIADIAAAALDRNSKTVPSVVSTAISRHVPTLVDTVCGCRIDEREITLCARCRMGVSFYVTISGSLACPGDGTMTFRPTAARIGLVRMPLPCLAWVGALRDVVVVSPDQSGFCVTRMISKKGSIKLDLASTTGR